MNNIRIFISIRKKWIIYFGIVMSIHFLLIYSMQVKEKLSTKAASVPPSAVVMVFPPLQKPTKKVKKKSIPEKKFNNNNDIVIEVEAKNGDFRQKIITKTTERKELYNDNIKEKEAKNIEALAVEEPKKEVNGIKETDKVINQQVSLQSESIIDSNAVAKDQDELAVVQWRHKVQGHLERLKRYPPMALKLKRQGTVIVKFHINNQGEILSSSIHKSSEIKLLDRATKQLLTKANPLPKPPSTMSFVQLTVEVPVKYSIK